MINTGLRVSVCNHDSQTCLSVGDATREALIESGIAADYMFQHLGNRRSRTGSTDNGDRFTLYRSPGKKFCIHLLLFSEPKMPRGMAKLNPYATDISGILARLVALP